LEEIRGKFLVGVAVGGAELVEHPEEVMEARGVVVGDGACGFQEEVVGPVGGEFEVEVLNLWGGGEGVGVIGVGGGAEGVCRNVGYVVLLLLLLLVMGLVRVVVFGRRRG